MTLALTMDLKLCAMSIATYLGDLLTPRDIAAESSKEVRLHLLSELRIRQKKSEPHQDNYFRSHFHDFLLESFVLMT
jgi:hypothetical protein